MKAFLTAQLLLSGPPILLFLGFSFTILTTSLLVCLVTALTVAFAFAGLCAGLALVILLPTLLVTSTAATFLFVSGFIGSAAVSKFSNDPRTEGIRSRTKSNAAAIGDRVKDASNGNIDLNATAQHLANRVSDSLPQTAEENPNDKRAREYLARQALGIPEKHEAAANGNNHASARDLSRAVTNEAYEDAAADHSATGDNAPYSAPYGSQDYVGKLQAVS